MLNLAGIHALYSTELNLSFLVGKQDLTSIPLPYVEFNLITDARLAPHQVHKEYTDPGGSPTVEYKNIIQADFSYEIVNDSGKTANHFENSQARTNDFYRFLLTDEFQTAMKTLDIGYDIATDITELSINKRDFFERRNLFEIRYFWADVWSRTEGSLIETVDINNGDLIISEP